MRSWHLAADAENKYAKFLEEVAERTGKLVALWQSVGFVHGVLNTDNMSILGETIDYGCASAPLHPKFRALGGGLVMCF